MEKANTIYLGDGLYGEYDGDQIRLYAHNGVHMLNEIFLDTRVLKSFLLWVEYLKQSKPELEEK